MATNEAVPNETHKRKRDDADDDDNAGRPATLQKYSPAERVFGIAELFDMIILNTVEEDWYDHRLFHNVTAKQYIFWLLDAQRVGQSWQQNITKSTVIRKLLGFELSDSALFSCFSPLLFDLNDGSRARDRAWRPRLNPKFAFAVAYMVLKKMNKLPYPYERWSRNNGPFEVLLRLTASWRRMQLFTNKSLKPFTGLVAEEYQRVLSKGKDKNADAGFIFEPASRKVRSSSLSNPYFTVLAHRGKHAASNQLSFTMAQLVADVSRTVGQNIKPFSGDIIEKMLVTYMDMDCFEDFAQSYDGGYDRRSKIQTQWYCVSQLSGYECGC